VNNGGIETFKSFPATIFRGSEPMPTISGFSVDPKELDLRESYLNPNKKENWNNHHGCFIRRSFTGLAMLQLCRDLELNQFGMLIDQHDYLHDSFGAPPPPTLLQCMDRLMAAKDCDESIRIGSLHKPKFRLLNEGDIFKVNREFNQEAQIKIVSYSQL